MKIPRSVPLRDYRADNNAEVTMDEVLAEVKEYQEAHKDESNPKTFHIYVLYPQNMTYWQPYVDKDVKALGMVWSERHRCWYWHEHLNPDHVLDIRDDAIIKHMKDKTDPTVGWFDFD